MAQLPADFAFRCRRGSSGNPPGKWVSASPSDRLEPDVIREAVLSSMGENVTRVPVSVSVADSADLRPVLSAAVTALLKLAFAPVLLLDTDCARSFPVVLRDNTAPLDRFSGEVDSDPTSESGVRLLRDRLNAPINLNAVGGGDMLAGGSGGDCGVSMLLRGVCVWATNATSDIGLVEGRCSAGFE